MDTPIKLSYNTCRELLSCPARTYWRKVKKKDAVVDSKALAYGTTFHETIGALVKGEEPPASKNGLLAKAKMLVEMLELDDRCQVEVYVERSYRGYLVRGYIDLITPDGILYELKTGVVNDDRINSYVMNPTQISFYSWLLGPADIDIKEYRMALVNSYLGLRKRIYQGKKYHYEPRTPDKFIEILYNLVPNHGLVTGLLDRSIDIIETSSMENNNWFQNRTNCYNYGSLCPYIMDCKQLVDMDIPF